MDWLSLGGEVLLGAASEYASIRAIVADGVTFRSINEYTALSANRPLYPTRACYELQRQKAMK